MTSKRNPSKRNLGPVLALTGAGIAIAAVIAGFIAVGGPGQARDERLDLFTEGHLFTTVEVLHCAFESSGGIPASFQEALDTPKKNPKPTADGPNCGQTQRTKDFTVELGTLPSIGKISYEAITPTSVQTCANFRSRQVRESGGDWGTEGELDINRAYPELVAPRPAGIRCYDIDLTKTGPISRGYSVID